MYRLAEDYVIRLVDNAHIPLDGANADYIEYLNWVTEGNIPQPVDIVPKVVSRFQARAALYEAGHLQNIETVMASPATEMLVKLAWQDAQEFRRNSPTVIALGYALGITESDLDQLFIAAAAIEA